MLPAASRGEKVLNTDWYSFRRLRKEIDSMSVNYYFITINSGAQV